MDYDVHYYLRRYFFFYSSRQQKDERQSTAKTNTKIYEHIVMTSCC